MDGGEGIAHLRWSGGWHSCHCSPGFVADPLSRQTLRISACFSATLALHLILRSRLQFSTDPHIHACKTLDIEEPMRTVTPHDLHP